MPALSRGRQFQKFFQTFALGAVNDKQIHAGGVRRIMQTLYKPGGNKGIQCFGHPLHVVPHKGGNLLVRQQASGMSVQENKQIKVTAVTDDGSASE